MSLEENLSWEFLKNLANALDSYRIRAFIDAKRDILEAGIYNEMQYENILYKMLDEERLKYSLFNFLKNNSENDLNTLKKFSQINSIEIVKTLSLFELLRNEKLLIVEELFDEIKGEEDTTERLIFKDFIIKILDEDNVKLKTIYEPVKVIFDSKNCSGCGLCAGICPVNCLHIYNGFGKIDEDKCIRCGLCYFVCPRTYLPVKILNMVQENTSEIKDYSKAGYFIEVYSARTKVKEISEVCQDGGISSTCIQYLLDNNKIDYALGAKMSNTLWRPEPLLIKNKEELISAAGTKYVNNPNLQLLNQNELNDKKIAVIGVPCQMQALLKSKIYNIGFPSLNNVEYRIGIFCMESFSYESLLKICEKVNIDIKNAKKMDINKGKFFIYPETGEELNIPIKEISNLAREDCEICYDLTSESADISIGSIGSPSGWNTVLIRTEKGKNLYNELIKSGLIESKPIQDVKPGLPLLQKIAGSKKTKSKKHIRLKMDENKRVPNY
ncbi:MAG: Coenzyme F420 hydrogenase/dehydrogenase, beta subunit C-terminal domain [Promethearchaeota archaeon]|nr:MAG: Coenzyme F420 hydrogenase/dehydrogenase, beta subunit C-terminal domain [Candidatus Lokiarchaeota archaeon]